MNIIFKLKAFLRGIAGITPVNKIFRATRWALLYLLCSVLQVKAAAIAQVVTIDRNHISLKHLFVEIRRQTGYDILYASEDIPDIDFSNFHVKDKPLSEVLDFCLKDQPLSYEIKDMAVLIRKKPAKLTVQGDWEITGSLKSENGESLVGATVTLKGTQIATSTDKNGRFSIKIPAKPSVLVVTLMGYEPQEKPIANKGDYQIVLKGTNSELDEVVVVGYGTTKKKDFTGSVGTLKLEDSPVALAPNLNPLQALKGTISGLDIGASNTAGGEPAMQIRGQNSISGSNNPLIVLDGVIYMGSLSDINPNDIASFDVLKDATSAAAYGSRSANGVIAITTKRGKNGKPIISFNTSTGFQNWYDRPVMLKGEEWIKLVNARNQYTEGSTNWLKAGEIANRDAGKETNWLDLIGQTGVLQTYQASVSGATDRTNFYLSGSYDKNKGIIVGDKFDRISLLGKLKFNVTNWLEIGTDAGYSRRNYSGFEANIVQAEITSPYGVVYRDDQGDLEKYPYEQSGVNPLWGVQDGTRDNVDLYHNYRLNSYALVKIPWVDGLSYRANYLVNQDNIYNANFTYENYYVQEGNSPDRYKPSTIQGFLSNANGNRESKSNYSYVFDNIVNYNKTFGKHSVDFTAVATRDYTRYERTNITGSDFAANGNTILGINGLSKATVQKNQIDGTERTNIGYLGRINYSYDDRYFVTGSYRRDGASVFGADNKWANFSAFGVAWKISSEDFLQTFTVLNNLKLKFSWGQNGNQGLDPYGTLSTVANGTSGGIRYEYSNTPGKIYYGLIQSALGNSSLGWETTSSWNTGFESAWLNNRISLDVDAYFSKTTNQIFTQNIPVMTGFKTMKTSMGRVDNKGLEINLRTVNIQNTDWNWSTSVTFWKNWNKLVSLYGQDLDGDGKEDDDIANSLFIGKSLDAIYGYKQIGIVQENDADYMALTGAAPGTPKYADLDGVPGITAADRTIVGYRKENFRLNFSTTLKYKQLSFYTMITGTFAGNNSYLRTNPFAFMSSGTGSFNDNLTYIPYWTSENASNVYPSATFAGDGRFLGLQSRGFARIQDVTLAYTFNQPWLKAAKINSLKVFVTGKNLLTITNWYGGDPETGTRIRESDGGNAVRFPLATTYSFGVNVGF
ncbi:TonB-linked outer membrane protein, SusC/RagA family [bacterium A37T11]|nr:TonB-linked outer membrane protein, SusC/RagA family [bacterium A37T11]